MIPRGVYGIPKNRQEAIDANNYLAPQFSNAIMGATTGPSMAETMGLRPMARGDIEFARTMSNNMDAKRFISPEQYNMLMKIAKSNLIGIPSKILSKLKPEQLLQELQGMAQKPR